LLEHHLAERRLPDLDALRACFMPDAAELPQVEVQLGSLRDYEVLFQPNVEVQA